MATSRINEQTSKRIASIAGRTLANKKADKFTKALAASALTQVPDQPYKSQRVWVKVENNRVEQVHLYKPETDWLLNEKWITAKIIFKKQRKKARR